MNLGLMFGYGNGMSWHPEPSELKKYPNRSYIRDAPLHYPITFSRRLAGLENVSLVVVDCFRSVVIKRGWQYADLPLPPSAGSLQGGSELLRI